MQKLVALEAAALPTNVSADGKVGSQNKEVMKAKKLSKNYKIIRTNYI